VVTNSSAILAVSDVPETVQFYKDVLGFPSGWFWGEPPTFGAVTWGKVTIMLSCDPVLAAKIEGHGHWLDVDDVDALYAGQLERGAEIVSPIEDKPWGRREYTIRDVNGYHLRFAGHPSHESKGTGQFPPGVEILCRMPTHKEFSRVAGIAFDRQGTQTEALERTWKAVVATDSAGEAIGVLRIMYDAPGWFSVWDVAVLPEWQGRRIGTAMVKAALDLVRDESPGAFVYLFTFKSEFYERMGFATEGVHMVKV